MSDDDPQDGKRKRIFDGLWSERVKKVLSQAADAIVDDRLNETIVGDVLKKAISKGSEVMDSTEGSLRKLLDLPWVKDLADKAVKRLDDMRGDLTDIMQDEVHGFLSHIDVGRELQKILTSMKVEVTLSMRFVPNDKALKPEVALERVERPERHHRRRHHRDGPEAPSEAAQDGTQKPAR